MKRDIKVTLEDADIILLNKRSRALGISRSRYVVKLLSEDVKRHSLADLMEDNSGEGMRVEENVILFPAVSKLLSES